MQPVDLVLLGAQAVFALVQVEDGAVVDDLAAIRHTRPRNPRDPGLDLRHVARHQPVRGRARASGPVIMCLVIGVRSKAAQALRIGEVLHRPRRYRRVPRPCSRTSGDHSMLTHWLPPARVASGTASPGKTGGSAPCRRWSVLVVVASVAHAALSSSVARIARARHCDPALPITPPPGWHCRRRTGPQPGSSALAYCAGTRHGAQSS